MVLETAFELTEDFSLGAIIKSRTTTPRASLEAPFVGMFGADLVALGQQTADTIDYRWWQAGLMRIFLEWQI